MAMPHAVPHAYDERWHDDERTMPSPFAGMGGPAASSTDAHLLVSPRHNVLRDIARMTPRGGGDDDTAAAAADGHAGGARCSRRAYGSQCQPPRAPLPLSAADLLDMERADREWRAANAAAARAAAEKAAHEARLAELQASRSGPPASWIHALDDDALACAAGAAAPVDGEEDFGEGCDEWCVLRRAL